MPSRRPSGGRRQFSRTDRIAERIREIVATELERLGGEDLELVTITDVRVDNELARAEVFYSALTATEEGRADNLADAFEEVRWRIQQVINRNVRARRTPQIEFVPDAVLSSALRIDDLIAGRAETDVIDPDAPEGGSAGTQAANHSAADPSPGAAPLPD
jgi:ribosome-binding factor A